MLCVIQLLHVQCDRMFVRFVDKYRCILEYNKYYIVIISDNIDGVPDHNDVQPTIQTINSSQATS